MKTVDEFGAALSRLQVRGGSAAVATVVGVRRSAPRPLGAKMLVFADGRFAGSVSGGCVEGAVLESAHEILRGGPSRLLTFGDEDRLGGHVGLPCGGEIDVWLRPYEPAGFLSRLEAGDPAVEVTVLDGSCAGRTLLVEEDGRTSGSLGSRALESDAIERALELMRSDRTASREGALFFDVSRPPAQLVLIGAGELAASLCKVALLSGWSVTVIDPRPRLTEAASLEGATVISAWPQAALREFELRPSTAVIALSHNSRIDDDALLIALPSAAGFVGALGSRTAQVRRRDRLAELGLAEHHLERLAGPVGLDLGAESISETAISILAEIVAVRHGRAGGRLVNEYGRIHEAVVP